MVRGLRIILKSLVFESEVKFSLATDVETLEHIYIGRRFKNDTERLEKLFELYTLMTANAPAAESARKRGTS